MSKSPIDRPDLRLSNAHVADAIAFDGTHLKKHGAELGIKTEAEYSRLIKDALDNPNTYGAPMRVAGDHIGYAPGRITPEFSSQTFYDPDRKLVVTSHLARDSSGKMIVKGTAHHGDQETYFTRLYINSVEGNNPLLQIKKESSHFERLARMQRGGRNAIVAAKLGQLAPNMMRRLFSHFGLVGAGMAAGLTKFFGGSNVEAMQAAADATPGLRIATAPNKDEKNVRTFDAYTAGFGGDPVRYVNDVLKSFGRGDPQIADGVVRDSARLVGTSIRAGYDAALGPKEMLPPLPSDIEQMINPGATEPPLFSASGRSRQPLSAAINASSPLAADVPPKAANASVVRQSTAQVATPLPGMRQRMAP